MLSQPLISIIIPVYNGEKYLSECLNCVIYQTYKNVEIIAVNDGSTDRSLEIIRSYAEQDHRFRIINQENKGVSAARNAALDVATGEFISFIDCDDLIDAKFLERCLEYANDYDVIAEDFCCKKQHLGHNFGHPKALSSGKYLQGVLYQTISNPSVCGKLFRRSVFDKQRFWDLRYEDLEIFPKIILRSSTVYLTGYTGYFYRQHSGSFIHAQSIERLDALAAVDSILETCINTENKDLIQAAEDRKLSASFNMLFLSSDQGLTDSISLCWNNIKALRHYNLTNPSVRLKNKIGILLSFLGRRQLLFINKIFKVSR